MMMSQSHLARCSRRSRLNRSRARSTIWRCRRRACRGRKRYRTVAPKAVAPPATQDEHVGQARSAVEIGRPVGSVETENAASLPFHNAALYTRQPSTRALRPEGECSARIEAAGQRTGGPRRLRKSARHRLGLRLGGPCDSSRSIPRLNKSEAAKAELRATMGLAGVTTTVGSRQSGRYGTSIVERRTVGTRQKLRRGPVSIRNLSGLAEIDHDLEAGIAF